MNDIVKLPSIHVQPSTVSMDSRNNTAELLAKGHEEEGLILTSKSGRKVTLIKQAMYGNFLRQSTKKLQDDLRKTMKNYSSEKQQLLRQLASLRHEMDDLQVSGSETPTSTESNTDTSTISGNPRNRSRRFYHAPNVAAHKLRKKKKDSFRHAEKTGEQKEEKKQKDGILKLPSIKESTIGSIHSPVVWSNKNSEWDSGQQISLNNLPPIHPQNSDISGVQAAQALLKESYVMPKIDDPDRSDIMTIPAGKKNSNGDKKKVQFSARNQIAVITGGTEVKIEDSDSDMDSKNSDSNGVLERNPHKKPKRLRARQHYLPPLELGTKRHLNPKETENHKMLYISIKDPEVRTKTLSEILHAVRLRMKENEQHLRFGEMPRRKNANNTYEFLLNNGLESNEARGKAGSRLGISQNASSRLSRRSNNSQLQNYLRKMTKSRRMTDNIEGDGYRLQHMTENKELLSVSRESDSIAA